MTVSAAHVRIWRQPDGSWRWCYVEPDRDGRDLVLLSHRAFARYEEAQHSARAAYPATRIERPAEPGEEARPRPNLLGTALAVVVLIAVLRRAWRSRSAGNGKRTVR